jgi:multidrug efflux pump subunit AcrA (membrane-fusion protein)
MKPGLSANCEITFQQTKDTLFIPNMALFDKDSSKVVYVLKNGKYQPVRVKTGLTGSSYTIITEGLKGDEVIALSQPPNSLINRVKMNKSKSDTIKTLNPE